MKLHKLLTPLILALALAIGCSDITEDRTGNYDLSGKVEKGAFIAGSIGTFHETNSTLNAIGTSYPILITDNDGSYHFRTSGLLPSAWGYISITGKFFDEWSGAVSTEKTSLFGITQAGDFYINIATTLMSFRQIELVTSYGMSASDAFDLALTEVMEALSLVLDPTISESAHSGEMLLLGYLATRQSSSIGRGTSLSNYITEIAINFSENGKISQALLDELYTIGTSDEQEAKEQAIINYYYTIGIVLESGFITDFYESLLENSLSTHDGLFHFPFNNATTTRNTETGSHSIFILTFTKVEIGLSFTLPTDPDYTGSIGMDRSGDTFTIIETDALLIAHVEHHLLPFQVNFSDGSDITLFMY